MFFKGVENITRHTTTPTPDPYYKEIHKQMPFLNFRLYEVQEERHSRLLKQMAPIQKLRVARELSERNLFEKESFHCSNEIVAKLQNDVVSNQGLMPLNLERKILDFIPKKLADRYEDVIANQMTIAKEQFSISILKDNMQHLIQENGDKKDYQKQNPKPHKKFLRIQKILEKKLLITEEPVRAVLELAVRELPEVVKNFKLYRPNASERRPNSLSVIINSIRREIEDINSFLRWTWYPKVAATLQRQLRKSVLPLNNLQVLLHCIEGLIKREILQMKQDLLSKLLNLIKDECSMPMHKLKLEICDRHIELTPNCDTLKQTYISLAHEIVNIGTKKLQCLALEMQLHNNGTQHIKLDLDDIYVGEFIGELTGTLVNIFQPIRCHLKDFEKRYEQLINATEHKTNDSEQLNIEETFGYIVEYTKFRHILCYESQTVELPLYIINAEPAINQLNTIAENLTKYNANKLVNHHITLLKAICHDFEEFKKRALKKPASTEELLKLFEFMSNGKKTTFVELRKRIKLVKEFGKRVDDVATFTQYHLNLQAKTFSWLRDIHILYDLSLNQMERFTLIFRNNLQFARNKLNCDIEVLVANISSLNKGGYESKLRKNKKFVQNIAIQYNEFLESVKWINKEEDLFKTPTTTYPQLEKILKFLNKFQNILT